MGLEEIVDLMLQHFPILTQAPPAGGAWPLMPSAPGVVSSSTPPSPPPRAGSVDLHMQGSSSRFWASSPPPRVVDSASDDGGTGPHLWLLPLPLSLSPRRTLSRSFPSSGTLSLPPSLEVTTLCLRTMRLLLRYFGGERRKWS